MTSRHSLIVLIPLLLVMSASTLFGATPAVTPGSDLLTAPPDDSTSQPAPIGPDRWRAMIGGVVAGYVDITRPLFVPIVNINYRWSPSFTPGKDHLVIGGTTEVGIYLIIPYAKGGLEIRSERFFADVHAGGVPLPLPPFLIPFVGVESGFRFPYGSSNMELETGINVVPAEPVFLLPYMTIGVAF